MIKLSIIIPVFNEEKTVGKVIEKISSIKFPFGITKEIIVVDDGSTDSSEFRIQNLKYKTIKKIFHEKNKGKGAAIRSGLKVATGDYVIIQDADFEYDPDYYADLLKPAFSDKYPIVYGTRLTNYPLIFWGERKTILPTHLIANKFLTMLTNLLYGSKITDMETGYKLFKREVLKGIVLKSNRFDFEAEVTAKILKKKIPIVEVPIFVKPRTYKDGKKICWVDGLYAIWTLIKYRFTD